MSKKDELEQQSLAVLDDIDRPFLTSVNPEKKINFKNPKEIESVIIGYLNFCNKTNRPPTVNGLAFTLGTDWNTLKRYMDDEQSIVGNIVRKTVTHFAALVEERIIDGSSSKGGVFWMKNIMDWKDKTEVEHKKSLTAAQLLEELKQKGTVREAEVEEIK